MQEDGGCCLNTKSFLTLFLLWITKSLRFVGIPEQPAHNGMLETHTFQTLFSLRKWADGNFLPISPSIQIWCKDFHRNLFFLPLSKNSCLIAGVLAVYLNTGRQTAGQYRMDTALGSRVAPTNINSISGSIWTSSTVLLLPRSPTAAVTTGMKSAGSLCRCRLSLTNTWNGGRRRCPPTTMFALTTLITV